MKRWANEPRFAGDVATVFGIAAAAQAAGLVGWVSGAGWALSDYGRYQGLLSNPNFAGLLAATALPALPYLLDRYPGLVRRGVLLGGGVVLVAALGLSGSRGALLAVLGGFAATAATRTQRARAARILWGACLVIPFAYLAQPSLFTTLSEGFSRIQQRTDLSAGRFEIYREVVDRWQQHPWMGSGFRTSENFGGGTATAHNIYLTLLSDLGLIGALLFAVFLFAVWRSAANTGRARALVGPAVAVLTVELTESSLFGFGAPSALLSWLWLLLFAATGPLQAGQNAGAAPEELPASVPADRPMAVRPRRQRLR
jgi:O-antigen ligase